MFKTVNYREETADVWIMITPRVLMNQEEENRTPAAVAAPGTVTDNLQKLEHARALMEQADHCRRGGQIEAARHIYERVRELCPGSRYAQIAARRLTRLPAQDGDQSVEVLTIKDGHVLKTSALLSGSEPKTDAKVSEYLSQYWQACAEGRLAEATQWGVQALALDPACFSKAHQAGWKKNTQPAVPPSAN
jgi:hypothetical protein